MGGVKRGGGWGKGVACFQRKGEISRTGADASFHTMFICEYLLDLSRKRFVFIKHIFVKLSLFLATSILF